MFLDSNLWLGEVCSDDDVNNNDTNDDANDDHDIRWTKARLYQALWLINQINQKANKITSLFIFS